MHELLYLWGRQVGTMSSWGQSSSAKSKAFAVTEMAKHFVPFVDLRPKSEDEISDNPIARTKHKESVRKLKPYVKVSLTIII